MPKGGFSMTDLPIVLSFIHISDSHVGPTSDFELHGKRPFAALDRVVSLINAFPHKPDFVLHSGDVTNDRSEASYRLASHILNRLDVPYYVIVGNHDSRDLTRRFLGAPADPGGDDKAPLNYRFEVKGERFMVVDATSPLIKDPSGYVSDETLAWVRAETQQDGPRLTILLHYPLFKMATPWLDEFMIVANGEKLHEALLPARDRLRGVFFGHLHRSSQIIRDGILYSCAPSTTIQYAWRFWDENPRADPDSQPGYNLVYYTAHEAMIRQYAFNV